MSMRKDLQETRKHPPIQGRNPDEYSTESNTVPGIPYNITESNMTGQQAMTILSYFAGYDGCANESGEDIPGQSQYCPVIEYRLKMITASLKAANSEFDEQAYLLGVRHARTGKKATNIRSEFGRWASRKLHLNNFK